MNEIISMVKEERDSGRRSGNHTKMWSLAEYINIYFYFAEHEDWDSEARRGPLSVVMWPSRGPHGDRSGRRELHCANFHSFNGKRRVCSFVFDCFF